MITCYDIVQTLVRTEKGTMMEADRKYLFHVAKVSNKIEIKNIKFKFSLFKIDLLSYFFILNWEINSENFIHQCLCAHLWTEKVFD